VLALGRKSLSPSAIFVRQKIGRRGETPCPAGVSRRLPCKHRGRAREAIPHSSSDPELFDDFPEIPTVLDGELGAIETFLGACLDQLLGID
jgi:hypothetical protein